MKMLIKTAKTLRNHWKKSLFGGTVITYGVIYMKNYIQTQNLMRVYCEKAAEYGRQPLPPHMNARHITVILNPNANKRKATDDFEKYCAPLLNLAGIFVEIIKTESEGHAKTLVENISRTDAIVIAGGDGTISEVVTGLLRKTQENANHLLPIGILPLGKNNSSAKTFFSKNGNLEKVRSLTDATLAIIEQSIRPIDIMKIEMLEDVSKPIYAVHSLKWGAYRDADVKKESYWYFGPLRRYATYIFNGLKSNISWKCDVSLNYSPPCDGCSNCYAKNVRVQPTGWFHKFIKDDSPQSKFASVINPECQSSQQKYVSTTDFNVFTNNSNPNSNVTPKLRLEIGPENINYFDFVKNGLKIEKGDKKDVEEVVEARVITLNPRIEENSWFSIDNEEFEVKPIKITLLPKLVNVFYTNSYHS